MTLPDLSVFGLLGYALVLLGLIGTVVPVVPGPFIIWLGALTWAWADGFQRIGWPALILMGVMALAAWGMDFMLTTVSSRKAGASWKSIGGAIVGGFIGGILLSGTPPILGTIVGAMLGAVIGLWLVEYRDKGERRAATRAVRAYIGSMFVAFILELTIAVMMSGIFLWLSTRPA